MHIFNNIDYKKKKNGIGHRDEIAWPAKWDTDMCIYRDTDYLHNSSVIINIHSIHILIMADCL